MPTSDSGKDDGGNTSNSGKDPSASTPDARPVPETEKVAEKVKKEVGGAGAGGKTGGG
jgi:hypothetical protein